MEWTRLGGQYIWLAVLLVFIAGLVYRYYAASKLTHTTLEIAEECAIGMQETQEDAAGAIETAWGTLAVLSQGMGRGRAGLMAAQVTVNTFLKIFTACDVTANIEYFFTQAFNHSNKKVLEYLQGNKGGAVAAAVLISKDYLYYAAIGDVKIAVLRNGELIAVNDGQTMQTAAIKGFAQGRLNREQALSISLKKRRSNYIGRDGFKNIEMGAEGIRLLHNDIIAVMNHGLYSCLSWVELESNLNSFNACEKIAERIIERFNEKNVPDKENASLYVIRYTGM